MDERDRGLMEEFRRRLLPDLAGHLRRLVVFDLLFLHAAGTVPSDCGSEAKLRKIPTSTLLH